MGVGVGSGREVGAGVAVGIEVVSGVGTGVAVGIGVAVSVGMGVVVGVSVGTEVGDGTIAFGANVGATTVDMKAIVDVGLESGIIVGTSCP